MKFLVDMNLSPRWTARLKAAGYECEHWSRIGVFDASDAQIMAFALVGDYVVLTHDLDFGAILAATGGTKPSVVQIRAENLNPDVIGDRVVAALAATAADLSAGALVTVDPGRERVTLLPLVPRDW
jgi:predicted nuclease of predicted toxin-antitoxin system